MRPPFKDEEIAAVRQYLAQQFPGDEIQEKQEGDLIAHSFRVVRKGAVAHEVLVRRLSFIDRPDVIKKILQHLGLWEESHAPPGRDPPAKEITFDPSYSQVI